jgi:hypothetical protein
MQFPLTDYVLENPFLKFSSPARDLTTDFYKKMAVFWVVAPCRLVEVTRRFRGGCCLRQGAYGGSKLF